jgi:hypothetical protein
MHKLDERESLSAEVFSERCEEVKCTPEDPMKTMDNLDVASIVQGCLTNLWSVWTTKKRPRTP